ncbi:hypothetical protein [Flaviaesturariibacter amylovorans]|uniref:DUF3127 domain-containing protein n=1 Tax=Flaviaesturariibacter amylovorans TaxID=1084520 RepID=A0ABP8H6C6_9BACT
MVKVTNVVLREGENGNFVLLELSGDLELVQSQKTGLFYGTVRKSTMPVTVDFESAKAFIGREIPGTIVRVECAPYNYVTEQGEVLELNYRWAYVPEEKMGMKELPTVDSQIA